MASPFTDQANSIETFIRSASPTTNFGSGTTFQVGTDAISLLNRSLIKWKTVISRHTGSFQSYGSTEI